MEKSNITPIPILEYAQQHSTPEDKLLYELYRATYLKILRPVMLSGHIQGMFLQWISMSMKPKKILEIGTYTAYSTICLAKGLQEGGLLTTIDNNPEIAYMQREFIEKAGMTDKINLVLGDATDVLKELAGQQFDLIFIDADKRRYPKYYEMCFDLLTDDGTILADNVLWDGKVVSDSKDADTETLRKFNKMVTDDPRVTNFLLPIRDGLMMIRKN